MINGVSSGQILRLQNFGGTRKLTTDKIFGMISIQLGGDGRSISRENLKQYIQKADDGLINCSEKQLKAFKLLDENWKDLFGDTDSITARDFNKASGIFAQIILAKEDKSDLEKLQDEIQKQIEKQKKAKEEQRRIIALGTTATRTLEAIMQKYHKFVACEEDTAIFIKPGYKFLAIDGLITNFHLPKSTLVMLVSAFSTRENILNAYNHAIKNNYHFFSFGDAMFIK